MVAMISTVGAALGVILGEVLKSGKLSNDQVDTCVLVPRRGGGRYYNLSDAVIISVADVDVAFLKRV